MKPSLYLIGLLTLSLAFAGCHAPENEAGDDDLPTSGDGGAGGTMPEGQELTFTVTDPVTEATVGEPFTLTVDVDAVHDTTTMHAGFHWSFNSTAGMTGLTGADFDGASPHVTDATAIPGSYTIPEWTFGEEHVGTIYVRAHVQIDGGDFFGEEFEIEVSAAS